jgi:hypothetical protein
MCDCVAIVKAIYRYYPKNCSYMDNTYKKAPEYLCRQKVLCDRTLRKNLQHKVKEAINAVFADYYVSTRHHSVDYPSEHFTILLHKNQPILDDDEVLLDSLGGIRLDLEVYFSLLSSYFYAFAIRTTRNEEKPCGLEFSSQDEPWINNKICQLSHACRSFGYRLMPYETAHMIVPDIETELLHKGEVKILNCLFSEFER